MSGQAKNNVESLSFPSSLRTITPSFPSNWKSISRLSPSPSPSYSSSHSQNTSQTPFVNQASIQQQSINQASIQQQPSVNQTCTQQQQQQPVNQASIQQNQTSVNQACTPQPPVSTGMNIILYPIDKLALCDSKRNLRFIPILSSAEATKQGEMNLIIDVKTLPTPSYIIEAAKLGYFFICSKSGKCVTVKDNLTLLICSDPNVIDDQCASNSIRKYVSFSQICKE
jgi:hypothetical protein